MLVRATEMSPPGATTARMSGCLCNSAVCTMQRAFAPKTCVHTKYARRQKMHDDICTSQLARQTEDVSASIAGRVSQRLSASDMQAGAAAVLHPIWQVHCSSLHFGLDAAACSLHSQKYIFKGSCWRACPARSLTSQCRWNGGCAPSTSHHVRVRFEAVQVSESAHLACP